jgi:hypothetical protein
VQWPPLRRSGGYFNPGSISVDWQIVTVRSSMLPIAAYQFMLNAPSSVGAKVNCIGLQAGID